MADVNLRSRKENPGRRRQPASAQHGAGSAPSSYDPLVLQNALLIFNKPMNVLCQFSESGDKLTLADFIDAPGYYPAGRLDYDSEGLLLLTNQGWLQARIAEPGFKLAKIYLVQVEGEITDAALLSLAQGVDLKDGQTRPAQAKRIDPPDLWERDPPVRFRRAIPTSWLSLGITEGRNRQVRRMTAAVGFPTLRLVRWQIGKLDITQLKPGEWRFQSVPQQLLPAAGATVRSTGFQGRKRPHAR